MPRPSFFLVGAPKCGTSSLCHYLKQHPKIFIPDRKELHFFASDLELPRFFSSEREYLHAFERPEKPHAGECTPWYLYSAAAAREIYRFNSYAKIIISVRNPTDMIYSLFRYRRYIGMEKGMSILSIIIQEEQYLASCRTGDKINPNRVYLSAATYYDQIKRYIEVFGQANVHFVVFDDIQNHSESVYRSILRFLKVNDDFQPFFRNVNKTGQIRSERFQERIAHLPAPLKRLAYAFPRGIRRPAYNALRRLNTSYSPPPPLDPELRRRLTDKFRPDVERLSALIGRDLTYWCAE